MRWYDPGPFAPPRPRERPDEGSHPGRRRGDAAATSDPRDAEARRAGRRPAFPPPSDRPSAGAGVREIVFSVAYRPERVEAVFGDGRAFGVRIRYAVEDSPLGTGGAVRNALDLLDERTVVLNGDVLTDVDLPAIIARHEAEKAQATILLTPVPNPSAYGLVETDAAGRVQRFLEKPRPEQITTNNINAGIYVLETPVLEMMPPGVNTSIERAFFPALLARGDRVLGPVHRGYWIDIGTPEKYLQVHRDILNRRFPVPLDGTPRADGFVHGTADVSPEALLDGHFYVGPRCRVAAGARLGPDAVLVADVRVEQGRVRARQRPLGGRRRRGRLRGGGQPRRARACGSAARAGCATRSSARGPWSATSRARCRRLQEAHEPPSNSNVEPDIFKAYDVRGLVPCQLAPEVARRIGRAFVDYLGAKRIAVGRDCRLSSPEISAAFVEGARSQGAHVTDLGIASAPTCSTTTSPATTSTAARSSPRPTTRRSGTGSRWSGAGPLALSGDAGIKEIREWLVAGRYAEEPAATGELTAATPRRRLRAPLPLVRAARGDPAAEGGARHRERHGRGGCFRDLREAPAGRRPCACTSTSTARSPTTPPTPWSRRTAATSWPACSRRRPTSASRGTATPTAASSSTTPASTFPATS